MHFFRRRGLPALLVLTVIVVALMASERGSDHLTPRERRKLERQIDLVDAPVEGLSPLERRHREDLIRLGRDEEIRAQLDAHRQAASAAAPGRLFACLGVPLFGLCLLGVVAWRWGLSDPGAAR